MYVYSLVDRATGEAIESDGCTVERLTGIEIAYINWVIEKNGKFENANWLIPESN